MNVLIIEDEHLAAERLQSKLIEIQPDINVLGVTESVLDTINWLNEHDRPDLIFMDVQLDDGICFEIFDSVQVETPIIFTTAYDRYAIQAFQVNSVDCSPAVYANADTSTTERRMKRMAANFQEHLPPSPPPMPPSFLPRVRQCCPELYWLEELGERLCSAAAAAPPAPPFSRSPPPPLPSVVAK